MAYEGHCYLKNTLERKWEDARVQIYFCLHTSIPHDDNGHFEHLE